MARKLLSDLEVGDKQIHFTVYDGKETENANLIYQSIKETRVNEEFNYLITTTPIILAGREWTIVWRPSPEFVPQQNLLFPSIFLVLAVIATIFFSGIFYLLSKLYGASAKALENNRKIITGIFDNAVDGIISYKKNGKISTYNKASEYIFQYTSQEIKSIHIKKLIPDPFSSQTNNEDETKNEQSTHRKDGSSFIIETSISEMVLDNELIYTAIVRDITARKEMEQVKDEFISIVSHELRTPLTSIQGALVLLKTHLGDSLVATDKKLLQISRDNCERLIELVNDILDMEKISAGKIDYTMAPTEMCMEVNNVVEMNRGYAEKYKITFKVTTDVDEVYCNVDKNRFAQALANLISNAAKFSPENELVLINVETQGKEVIISVADKGAGIPKAFHEKIFGKFSQADSSSRRTKGGTGLGLNITKSIIEAFNGKITFETEEGKGTTFYINLPIYNEKTQSREAKYG